MKVIPWQLGNPFLVISALEDVHINLAQYNYSRISFNNCIKMTDGYSNNPLIKPFPRTLENTYWIKSKITDSEKFHTYLFTAKYTL